MERIQLFTLIQIVQLDLSEKLIEILSEKTIFKTYEEKTKNVKIPSWKDCANKTWKELGSI